MSRSSEEPSARTCNLCDGAAIVLLRGPPAIVRCRECGLVSLAEFPGREEREAGYQENYYTEGTGGRFL